MSDSSHAVVSTRPGSLSERLHEFNSVCVSMMSPNEYRSGSILGLGAMDCQDNNRDSQLLLSGLLGTINQQNCTTCCPQLLQSCIGHTGHMELVACDLMYHHSALHVYHLLTCFCFACSKSLVSFDGDELGTGTKEKDITSSLSSDIIIPNINNELHAKISNLRNKDYKILYQLLVNEYPDHAHSVDLLSIESDDVDHELVHLTPKEKTHLKLVFPAKKKTQLPVKADTTTDPKQCENTHAQSQKENSNRVQVPFRIQDHLKWLDTKDFKNGFELIQQTKQCITRMGYGPHIADEATSVEFIDSQSALSCLTNRLYAYAFQVESMFAECYACLVERASDLQHTNKQKRTSVNPHTLGQLARIVKVLCRQLHHIEGIKCLTMRGIQDQYTWHEEQVYTLTQRCDSLKHNGIKFFQRLADKTLKSFQESKLHNIRTALTKRQAQLQQAQFKLNEWRRIQQHAHQFYCQYALSHKTRRVLIQTANGSKQKQKQVNRLHIPKHDSTTQFTQKVDISHKIIQNCYNQTKRRTKICCNPVFGGCGAVQPQFRMCKKSFGIRASFALPSDWIQPAVVDSNTISSNTSIEHGCSPFFQGHVISPFMRPSWYNNWSGTFVLDASWIAGILRRVPRQCKQELSNSRLNSSIENVCTPVVNLPPMCIFSSPSKRGAQLFSRIVDNATSTGKHGEVDSRLQILQNIIMYNNRQCSTVQELEEKLGRVWNRGEANRSIFEVWRQVACMKSDSASIHLRLNCMFTPLANIGSAQDYSLSPRRRKTGGGNRKKIAQYISESCPSVHQIINGKQGLVRFNIMGKNVNYSFRAVLGVCTNISIDECGIGGDIARKMFVKVTVSESNIDMVRSYVRDVRERRKLLARQTKMINQSSVAFQCDTSERMTDYKYGDVYPSIGFMERPSSGDKKLFTIWHSDTKYEEFLHCGDIIEISIQDGDELMVNRQPTLWKHGMAALRVKIINRSGCSLWLHPCHLLKFAGDCDGDVVSGHFVSSKWNRIHTQLSLGVQQDLVCAQTGANLLGLIQDQILILSNLSSPKHSHIQTTDWLLVCMGLAYWHSSLKAVDNGNEYGQWVRKVEIVRDGATRAWAQISGTPWTLENVQSDQCALRILLYFVFPRTFCYEYKGVLIQNGIWVHGQFLNTHLGATPGNILSQLYAEYDVSTTLSVINDLTWITREYAKRSGLGLSMIDLLPCTADPTSISEYNAVNWTTYKQEARVRKSHSTSARRRQTVECSTTSIRSSHTQLPIPFGSTCEIAVWEHKMAKLVTHSKHKEMMSEQVTNMEHCIADVTQADIERATQASEQGDVLTEMIISGSKGKAADLSALRVSTGLQLLDGQFLHTSADGRISSHVKAGDSDITGWCESSLTQGLNAQELVCHLINARKKLCDSSAQVHTTGAMNRAGLHMLLGYERRLGGLVANRSDDVLLFDDGSNYSGRGLVHTHVPFNQFLLQRRPWITPALSSSASEQTPTVIFTGTQRKSLKRKFVPQQTKLDE